ncbi:hypothetical protein [Pseudomonas sp. R3-41]
MNDRYSVFINAGAVVMLSRSMAEQEKNDVLESLLFAQLVAHKKYPGYAMVSKWYEAYREVLKNAWLQKTVAWGNFLPDEECHLTTAQWLGRRLEEFADQTAADEVICLLDRIAKLPGTLPAMKQLREHVVLPQANDESAARICLQVILAQPGTLLSSVYLNYETSQADISNPFGQCLSVANAVGNVQSKCFQACLSKELYEQLRGAIVQKLGDKPAKHIFDISSAVELDPAEVAP